MPQLKDASIRNKFALLIAFPLLTLFSFLAILSRYQSERGSHKTLT